MTRDEMIAAIADIIRLAVEGERERATRIIEQNMLCTGPDGTEILLPRTNSGNMIGLAYAAAIRRPD